MALSCPRCDSVDLEEVEVDGVLIDRCVQCAGLWFDHNEINQIVDMTPSAKLVDSVIPPPAAAVESLICPRCEGVALRRYRIGGNGSLLLVYRCASCSGSWMDRGQLRQVEDPRIAESLKKHLGLVFGK